MLAALESSALAAAEASRKRESEAAEENARAVVAAREGREAALVRLRELEEQLQAADRRHADTEAQLASRERELAAEREAHIGADRKVGALLQRLRRHEEEARTGDLRRKEAEKLAESRSALVEELR